MKIGILIRQPNYTADHLVEAARARGHQVLCIRFPECVVSSKDIKYQGKSLRELDVVIPRIMAEVTTEGARLTRVLEQMGVYTLTGADAMIAANDKLLTANILTKANVKIPQTIASDDRAAIEELIAKVVTTPLVIKPVNGMQGEGVVLVKSSEEAEAVMHDFDQRSEKFLVQEFIAEASGSDIRVLVVGDKIASAYKRQSADGDFRSNIHQGGTGTPIVLSAAEKATAIKAAQAMKLAVCGVDIIRSIRGPLVLEVNAAPSLEGIEAVTKLDLATPIIQYIEETMKSEK